MSRGMPSARGRSAMPRVMMSSSSVPQRPSEQSMTRSWSCKTMGPPTSNMGRTVEPRQVKRTLRLTSLSEAPLLALASR